MNVSDFKTLIRAFSNERSLVIAKYLKNKVVFQQQKCYFLRSNITYEKITDYEDKLLPVITGLLIKSFRDLTECDRNDIEEITGYKAIFENAHVKKYMPQLKADLTNESIQFDAYTNEIHHNYGYHDIKENTFSKRKLGKHFITTCINYDYFEPKQESIDFVMNKIKKIYPDNTALEAVLTILGSALTGIAIRGSYILFFIGEGSAGKSTIMDLAKYTVQCYLKQIKPDMFVEGKNTDKIVNTYDTSKYIRITWLNEPKDKKFDATFFKSWADGECNAEKLYTEGSHDFKHYSLTFLTANNMPNIAVDSGTRRRLRACPHTSKFVDNKCDVDTANNVYLKDEDFKQDIEESAELKNAFFKILITRAHKWLKTKKIELPESFKELTETISDSNDHMKDFIDGTLNKTDDEKDKIGKQEMMKLYTTMYPNKQLTLLQLQMLLKERGVKYNRQLRNGGIQGCFYGIKLKDEYEDDDKEEIQELSVKVSLDEQIEHYTKLLRKLKQDKIEGLTNDWNELNAPKEKPKTSFFDRVLVKKDEPEPDEKPIKIKKEKVKEKKKAVIDVTGFLEEMESENGFETNIFNII
jgi:hypothetical protein